MILIPHVSTKELAQFAERLRTVVEKSSVCVVDQKLTFQITISIGGVVGLSENSQTMISQADGLLYDAKKSGRNCVKV